MTTFYSRRPRMRTAFAALAATSLLGAGLVGCAAQTTTPEETSGSSASSAEDCVDFSQTVKVAQAPVTDFAPVWVALEEGFFTDNGLTVELAEPSGTGAESVALINSGQVDMVAGSPSAMLSAAAQNIMTQVVSGMTIFPADENRDPAAIIVSKDSDITSVTDLVGKKVGVTSINSQQQTKVMGTVDANGGDSSAIEFIQVPPASMGALVESGEIDAAQPFEPGATGLLDTGNFNVIGYANWQSIGGAPAMFLTSTPDWITENSCATTATQKAISEAVDFINDEANQDRFVEILTEYQQAEPDVLERMRTDDFTVEFTADDYGILMDNLIEYGVLPAEVDMEPLIGNAGVAVK